MLIAILNNCSQEELEEESATSMASTPASPPMISYDPESTEFKRRAIKNKILAIGRMSRMFQVLREESEQISELKLASGGRLPEGTLALGSEGIKKAIDSFEQAKKADEQNEKLPPTDVVPAKRRKSEAIAEAAAKDPGAKIASIARKLSV